MTRNIKQVLQPVVTSLIVIPQFSQNYSYFIIFSITEIMLRPPKVTYLLILLISSTLVVQIT
jgi:hypothetical protein